MTVVREMLDATALDASVDLNKVAEALVALTEAERTSTACSSAMIMSSSSTASAAIEADLDFMDVCQATQRVLARSSVPDRSLLRALLEASITAGERSYAECSRHAPHQAHCRLCAEASKRALDACRALQAGIA